LHASFAFAGTFSKDAREKAECIRIEFLFEEALNQGVLNEEPVFHGVVDESLKQGVIFSTAFPITSIGVDVLSPPLLYLLGYR
jgi:hypothetical protein